jgi:broad specificity phosphatase PhoE
LFLSFVCTQVAAEYLKQFNLQHVAASPLTRAKFGAHEVLTRQANSENTEIKVYEGFTELDRGAWCGKTKEEIGSDMMARFDACDESATPEGGESYPQLKERVLAARDQLLEITDCGRASVVVSHLQVTRSMLSDALSIPTKEMYKFKIATASVACVDFNTETGEQTVHFQNFKPDIGLTKSKDGAN